MDPVAATQGLDDALLSQIRNLIRDDRSDPEQHIAKVMQFLSQTRPKYHWVGVYVLVDSMLHLGPYVGPVTDHTRIPVGRGVCGSAVAENRNKIIHDVRLLGNYLACNLETRSEIVVLIRDDATGEVLGQIDVDGTEVGGFGRDDEVFLDSIGRLLAPATRVLRDRWRAAERSDEA